MKKQTNWKRITGILGAVATIVGLWVTLGLPTFKKDTPKKPSVVITHVFDGDTPVQSVLIVSDGDTTEVRTPTGNSKMITIE